MFQKSLTGFVTGQVLKYMQMQKRETMSESRNTIYREMVIDLLYRLRLADDLFCQASDAVMSAIGLEDAAGKAEATSLLRSYAKSLQVIYADFLHLVEGQHVVFPAEVSLWQWNEPDGEGAIARIMERLHFIAEGMEMRLNAELAKREARK